MSLNLKSTVEEIENWITEEDTLKIMLEMGMIGGYAIVEKAYSYEQGQAVMNIINNAPNHEDVVIDLELIDSITSNFLHGMVSECPRLHSKGYREKYIHILSESARINKLINEEVQLYTK